MVPLGAAISACSGAATPHKPPALATEPPPGVVAHGTAAPTPHESVAVPPTAAPPLEATAPPPPVPMFLSAKVVTKSDPTWATCHRTFKPGGKDVSKDVSTMALGCANATKMKLVGKTIVGKESDSERPQSYSLQAEANHCYRAYVEADAAIKEFDVAIEDSTGAISDQHSNDTGTAVVSDDGAVCFNAEDAANVTVSVGMGEGSYALQIWGD